MAKSKFGIGVIGSWAFLVGVILAVVLGLLPGMLSEVWITVLLVIGLIVGLLNVSDKEAMPFLMSGVVLVIVSYAGGQSLAALTDSLPWITNVLNALLLIFVPATVIVAVRNVFGMARG